MFTANILVIIQTLEILEKGLFWTFETNIEHISVKVSLYKAITLEPLIKQLSWMITFLTFS